MNLSVRPRRDTGDVIWAAAAVATGAVLGALVAETSLVLLPAVLLVGAVTAWCYPGPTLIAGLFGLSLFQGLYLYYRVDIGGAPISLPDCVPWLFLIAAGSLRHRARVAADAFVPAARGILVLMALGLGLGTFLGVAEHASVYELFRIFRVEMGLLVGLTAAFAAAHVPEWRRAVQTGLYIAGITAAAQILVNYVWTLTTGQSFFALFPFGHAISDPGSVITKDNINSLRTTAVSTYLMLPALCLACVRMRRWDPFVVGLIVAASLVSLSRGFWIAFAGTVILLLVFTVTSGAVSARAGLKWVLVMVTAGVVAIATTGNILDIRLGQALVLRDESATFRRAETVAAWSRLSSDPLSFVMGTGEGVIISHRYMLAGAGQTANLENSLLSRWTNLTIFSAIGAAALLLMSAMRGWRDAASRMEERGLYAMSLSAPLLLIGGVVGGTLFGLQGTLPFWILAGTVLGSARRRVGGRSRTPPGWRMTARESTPSGEAAQVSVRDGAR